MKQALILDCDGVLADTERDGHRVAFNAAFDEFGLPLSWTDERYAELVGIGGGKERLASVITPALREELGLDSDEELREAIATWHAAKSRHFQELVTSGAMPARPGVKRLVAEALGRGWAVAVASTSAQKSVDAVLRHAVGPDLVHWVRVYAGDIVAQKKPAPDIYLHALEDIGIDAERAVVVEDSGVGCRAAVTADLPVIVTTSAYTGEDDFTGAALILSDLGEPDHPATVVEDRWNVNLDPAVVSVAVLEQVLYRRASRS